MEFVKKESPYIRKDTSSNKMMLDVLIALIPVVAFAIYRFGFDAIIRILVSLVVMIGLEAVAVAMMTRPKGDTFFESLKSRFQNYSLTNVTAPAVSAVIFAMIIPSKLPIYAVVVGAAFAIVIVKMVFGGLGSNIFNVAAGGRIFIGIALLSMFNGAYEGIDALAGATPLGALANHDFNFLLHSYTISDLFLGNIPGSMGEISALAILLGLAYLLIRRTADWRVVVSSLGTFILLTLFVGLAKYDGQVFNFVLYSVFSGGLLFGIVFMATDPVTSPVTGPGRFIYGALIASVIVLIRSFGSYPEGVAFAILFSNMFVPLIDYGKWSTNKVKPWFVVGLSAFIVIMCAIVFFGAGGSL